MPVWFREALSADAAAAADPMTTPTATTTFATDTMTAPYRSHRRRQQHSASPTVITLAAGRDRIP
jgi:hypothetical protein